MELILLQKVANLGNIGDRVRVKSGYGRNFLLPKGKATLAPPARDVPAAPDVAPKLAPPPPMPMPEVAPIVFPLVVPILTVPARTVIPWKIPDPTVAAPLVVEKVNPLMVLP